MKRVIFAILLLVVIITAGVLENEYVHKTFNALDSKLKDLEVSISSHNQNSLEQINDLSNWWEQKRKYLELIAFSPDVRAFSVALAEAVGSLECADFNNALSKCKSLIIMANNIHRLLDFNAEDII